jgi:hypothetical protein
MVVKAKPMSIAELDAARTPDGFWTRDQIEAWGLGWPPAPGWKARLIDEALREDIAREQQSRAAG